MEVGRVYCEVKRSKNPSGINPKRKGEKKEVTQRMDVRVAREMIEKKSTPGAVTERETEREGGSKGERGWEKAF